MNKRYDIFKTMIGIITIGLLILQSYGMAHNRFSWWNIPVSMILLILVRSEEHTSELQSPR